MRAITLALGAALAAAASLPAEVRLPSIFSDHMVLQAGAGTAIWGWADPGEEVTVSLAGQSCSAVADRSGRWNARFAELKPAAGGLRLEAKGAHNAVAAQDVQVGEVWLCSGQSNMEMQVDGLHGKVDHAADEIAAADYPAIRMYEFQETYDIVKLAVPPDAPLADRAGRWVVCSPATVAHFSAVGYFFGRALYRRLHVPIGLIEAAVGGTPIEAWTSRSAQEAVPELRPILDSWAQKLDHYDPKTDFAMTKRHRNLMVSNPGGLFNGIIAPLIPYSLRGVIWYQGERNAAGPFTGDYGRQLKTLVADWRARWQRPFYFAWVQLPRFGKEQKLPAEKNGWGVAVRDEMRKTLSVPRTGMAIMIDTGGVTAGHPTTKVPVGERLALLAFHDVYGLPVEEWSGPLFRSGTVADGKVVLTFDHAAGLRPAGGELHGFAIAGADRRFVWARAEIRGGQVVVWNAQVAKPAAVRYGWAGNPSCNLVNGAGLPASPFGADW